MAGSDLMSVSQALRTDQSVALRTALRDSCFQYNLVVMKVINVLNWDTCNSYFCYFVFHVTENR